MAKTENEGLIVGRNPVREALERRSGEIEKVLLQKGARGLDTIRRDAARASVPVQYVPLQKLNQMAAGLNHQGAVAVAAPIGYREVDEMLAEIAPDLDAVRAHKPVLLILDQVEDPHNFGALLRTAVAAGCNGVIVPQRHMAPLSAVAVKASAGTASRIPIARTDRLADVLFQLKERGYWVVGTDGESETTLWTFDWDRPLAVVMGSEGRGLRPGIAERCDALVSIPLRGDAESLNVSVAAGVVLFEVVRTRIV